MCCHCIICQRITLSVQIKITFAYCEEHLYPPAFFINSDAFILIQIYIFGNKTETLFKFIAFADIKHFCRNVLPYDKNKHSKFKTICMLCVVVDFCKKFDLFGAVTFKHEIINDKNIGTILEIQWNTGIFDDSLGKNRCEMNPVNLNHLHKTIHSILCKSGGVPSCDHVHAHTSVRKNQQKQILKDFRYRNPFLFAGVRCIQNRGNMKSCKKSFDRF